ELVGEGVAIVALVLVDAVDGAHLDAAHVDAVPAKPRDHPGHLALVSLGSQVPAGARAAFDGSRAPEGAAPDSAQLGFLVEHVLACHRVVLLELELVRGVLAVLHRGVEVPGPRGRLELDLLALSLLRHVGVSLSSLSWSRGPAPA